MADGFRLSLDVKGLRTLARTLKRAGADMNDLKAAYLKTANAVKPEIKTAAPRRSGRLSRSVRASATQKSGVVRAGSKSVPYAGPINYGWPGHNIRPRYFMQDGLVQAQDEVDDIFAEALQKAISQIHGE